MIAKRTVNISYFALSTSPNCKKHSKYKLLCTLITCSSSGRSSSSSSSGGRCSRNLPHLITFRPKLSVPQHGFVQHLESEVRALRWSRLAVVFFSRGGRVAGHVLQLLRAPGGGKATDDCRKHVSQLPAERHVRRSGARNVLLQRTLSSGMASGIPSALPGSERIPRGPSAFPSDDVFLRRPCWQLQPNHRHRRLHLGVRLLSPHRGQLTVVHLSAVYVYRSFLR